MPIRGRVAAALADSAAVVAAWGAMLLAECVVVLLLWPEQFSASWEYALARRSAVPMALAMLVPAAPLVVLAWKVAGRASRGRAAAGVALTVAGGVAVGAVALGVSTGRHFASLGVRGAFVAGLGALGAAAARPVASAVARLARRPLALAALAIVLAAGAWVADAFVLPRLYPAFHVAMFVGALAGGALLGLSFRPNRPRVSRLAAFVSSGVALGAAACIAWVPHAVRDLERASNLRIALVEHAPLLGRAVLLASRARTRQAEGPSTAASIRAEPRGRPRARLERPRPRGSLDRRAARRPPVCVRLSAPDDAEHRSPRARGHDVRERVLPHSSHLVFDHVDDDGQVPAAALRSRLGAGLRDVGPAPAQVRMAHGGVLPARRVLHRRRTLSYLRARKARVRIREGRVRRSGAARVAGGRVSRARADRDAALLVGSLLRAARAVRLARGPRLRRGTVGGHRRVRQRGGDGRRRRRADRPRRAGTAAGRRRDRDGGPRRGVRRARRPLPRHDRLRRAGARAPGGRRSRRAQGRARDERGADDRPAADGALGAGHPAACTGARARSRGRCSRATRTRRRRPASPSPRPTITR